MVSKSCSLFFTLCFVAIAAEIPQPVSNALTADARQGMQSAIPAPKPLTPEMRADIYMARKQYREAADIYSEGADKSAVMANKLGIAYHQMLQFDSARKSYERAVRLNPQYPEAINNLGTIYYAQKKFRKAVSQYKRALQLSPESASIYSNLGTAHFARKKYELALEAYQKAVSIDPDVFERRSSMGVLLQERTVAERAKWHFYLARTYAKAGASERALLYIRKALEEGFAERDKLNDSEFAALRELPEFQELLKLEPRAL